LVPRFFLKINVANSQSLCRATGVAAIGAVALAMNAAVAAGGAGGEKTQNRTETGCEVYYCIEKGMKEGINEE